MARAIPVAATARLCLLYGLLALSLAQSPPVIPKAAPLPENKFATVNAVRLHYLDWGGSGETLLFLTSLGRNGW